MNAVLAIVYADVGNFPAGSVVANIVATVTGAVNTTPVSQSVAPATTSVTFADLPADTYTYSVAAVDSANNIFGTPVTGTFTVSAPTTVTLSLPSTVTASVS